MDGGGRHGRFAGAWLPPAPQGKARRPWRQRRRSLGPATTAKRPTRFEPIQSRPFARGGGRGGDGCLVHLLEQALVAVGQTRRCAFAGRGLARHASSVAAAMRHRCQTPGRPACRLRHRARRGSSAARLSTNASSSAACGAVHEPLAASCSWPSRWVALRSGAAAKTSLPTMSAPGLRAEDDLAGS